MASIEEIRRISIIASTQGAAAATTQLNQLAAAQTNVATSATGIATSTNNAAGSALSAANKVEGLRRAHDAAYASQRKLEAGQRTVMTALNQGGISTDMAASTLLALERRYGAVGAAANVAAKAHMGHAAAMGNSRAGAMELEHSVRAIGDALAAGANPLRVFTQEFARLSEAASLSGGFGNVLRGAGAMFAPILRPLLSPLGVAGGLALGAGALGAYAFTGYQNRLLGLQTSLNTGGRATGLTLGGLNNLALGSAGGLTSSAQAQEAVAALAASGRISPEIMSGLVGGGVVQQFGRTTGVGFGEATKTLAGAFSDPTKGAAELNKQFGFLDGSQMELITHLDAGGDRLKAQGALLEDLRNRIQGAADVTSIWAKAWEGVSPGASTALGVIGRALSPSLEDELAAIVARNRPGGFGSFFAGHSNPADISRESSLREQIARNDQAAYFKGVDQNAIEKSLDILEITRRTIPDIGARQTLLDQRDKLQAAMNTPGAMERSGMTPDQANEAMSRANNGLTYLATAAEKVAQDSMLAAQAIQARTAQERTAIEAQKAWLDVMRSSHDATEAAASALAKWNDAIAQSNKQADDALRSANDRAGMIGLSPLQRDLQENANRFRDYRRESVFGVSALDASMTALDTSGGFSDKGLINYSRNIAPKITSSAGQDALWGHYLSTTAPAAVASIVAPRIGGYPTGAMTGGALPSTAVGNFNTAEGISRGAILDEHTTEVMRLANVELQKQQGLLDARAGAWAKNTDQLNKAVAVQEQWNRLGLTDVDKATLGPTRMASLAASVNQSADTTVSQQQQQRQQQQQLDEINQLNDGLRSFTSGSLGDIFNEFSRGTSRDDILGQLSRSQQNSYYTGHTSLNQARMEAAQRQIQTLASRSLINYGVGVLTGGLFGHGQIGSSGYQPGLLGGLLGGLFGGGATYQGGAPDWSSGIGLFHSGGIVGGFAPTRSVDPSLWHGAPRFHDGGLVAGERPIIARDGEGVFTAQQMKAMGSGGAVHNWNIQSGDVVIQGNADERTIPVIQAMIAQNNATLTKQITRNLGDIQNRNAALYR